MTSLLIILAAGLLQIKAVSIWLFIVLYALVSFYLSENCYLSISVLCLLSPKLFLVLLLARFKSDFTRPLRQNCAHRCRSACLAQDK